MIQNRVKHIFAPVLLILILLYTYSCQEITKYSEIPFISYESHISGDSTDILGNKVKFVTLTFSVIDGDADFGLMDSDTMPPYDTIYNYNFFSTLFAKTGGEYQEMEILLGNYRIPFLEGESGKAYKADIDIKFEYFYALMPADTIKYEFYVVDKALNQSNIVQTPEIIFN